MAHPTYIYLHGFASGPGSAKAIFFQEKFRGLGINLLIPDLNKPDFQSFSLSRNIHTVSQLLPPAPAPVILIGSSFGGLTAAWVAQQYPQVSKIILLAPAFEFLAAWLPVIGTQVQQWQAQGYLNVEHHAYGKTMPLSYSFITDQQNYEENELTHPVPTYIFHGDQDEVIPVNASLRFQEHRPWVAVKVLRGDHGLLGNSAEIWQDIQGICKLA